MKRLSRIFLVFVLCILIGVNVQAQNKSVKTKFKKSQKISGTSLTKTGNLSSGLNKANLPALSKKLKNANMQGNLRKGSSPATPRLSNLLSRLKGNPVQINRSQKAKKELTGVKIHRHEKNGTPVFLSGKGLSKHTPKLSKAASGSQTALTFVVENKEIFRLSDPFNELKFEKEILEKNGTKHVEFKQYYNNIPVWAHNIVFHMKPDNQIYSINARYSPTPEEIDPDIINTGSSEAVNISINDLSRLKKIEDFSPAVRKLLAYDGPEVKKYIFVDIKTQQQYLVWHVNIRPNLVENWYYFIDAQTGKIIEKYNAAPSDGPVTTSAVDLNGVTQTIDTYLYGTSYYLIDASRQMWQSGQTDILDDPQGVIWTLDARSTDTGPMYYMASADNAWSDPISVSANYNAGVSYDYYYNILGRNSYDDEGSSILSIVHITDDGESMANAYWNGRFIGYGDGGAIFNPLSGSLDVVAHELTHAVIQHTVGLEYKFQSGALNEGFADWGGAMIDRDDWLIGEDICDPASGYFPSGAMRNMEDPHNGGNSVNYYWQPANMDEFLVKDIEDDHGGVHGNSGVINRATYLIATAIGKDKLEQIYYRILYGKYLNSQAQFIDMRLAAIQSATELYGAGSAEVTAVKDAYDAVGILGDEGTEIPEDIPAVVGEEWIAVISAGATLYSIKPDWSDIKQLTTTQVNTGTSCPMSVSDDGSIIIFVDTDNYIRYALTDGSLESVLSTDGDWWSIALSPDGTKLAATTSYIDSSIHVFDLVNPENSKTIKLYSPTTSGGRSNTAIYADALDWDLSSEHILYDAMNRIQQAEGDPIEYWDVNVLDVEHEIVYSIFPTLAEGYSMGNPSFAQTNDNVFVFEYINFDQEVYEIWAVDLFYRETGLILENGTSLGFPDYSTDDTRLVYQWYESSTEKYKLRQVPLASNKIEASGSSVSWADNAQLPTWYAVGKRTDVEEEQITLPSGYVLDQNYPNPFNPETQIRYELPKLSKVTIKICDVLGREVRILVNEKVPAGRHAVTWDGRNQNGIKVSSGVYLYHFQAGDFRTSKKMVLLK
ncbi:M4 family metallopeptidase [candidate division KSB1 bacterium]